VLNPKRVRNPNWVLKLTRNSRVSLKPETHPHSLLQDTYPEALDREIGKGHTALVRKVVEYRVRPSEDTREGGVVSESLFEFVAGELERQSDLENLEARGTIRLALKSSGLTAREVTREQMVVVIDQIMPRELRARGVEDPEAVCGELSKAVKGFEAEADESASKSPEDVFRRLSRS
jgi:hypothetical protein